MQLVINGDAREFPAGVTVGRLLGVLDIAAPEGRGVAVAVDGEVVPRGAWEQTPLREGARVEVVVAVQGG